MTTPAPPPPQQPVQQPPQQQDDDALDDTALAVAIAAFLAGLAVAASYAASIALLLASLRLRFSLSRKALQALGAVLSFVTSAPPAVTGTIGPASRQVQSMNMARRAQYVVAAAKRVRAAEEQARAKGESVKAAREAALARERRYYEQHQGAMWNRAAAAGRVDMEAAVHGNLLGWLSVKDRRTSPECAAASGKNFYASRMPDIGFPGSVHPSCRCMPVAPWPGGKLLPTRSLKFARAAWRNGGPR